MKIGKQVSLDKIEELLQPSTEIRKLQGYGRRQLHGQLETAWELCPWNGNSTIGQN
jgi:hypothetical protein